jgi:hypothetical protein
MLPGHITGRKACVNVRNHLMENLSGPMELAWHSDYLT